MMKIAPSVNMKNIAACATGLWPTQRSDSFFRNR